MDRTTMQKHLAQAERHVTKGHRHVARQRELLVELMRDGRDELAAQAYRLLIQFEELQEIHLVDRDRLLRELGEKD